MQGTVKDFKTEYLSRLEGGSTYTPKNTQTQTPTNDEIIAGTGLFGGMVHGLPTQTPTNPNDVEQVNLAQMAGGKNGSLEIQKYLYETGLQNIFNDYNKQIANLDASKQKEIEDAYYVRELSKKYLGEYASNTGVGDVSGQLLDIYGKYQSNMNEINANFNELQTGLESSYNDKKNEYELGLLQTQMNIETAEKQEQLEKELAEINHNISLGLYPEGMNSEDYLDSVRDKIGESNYWNEMAKHKLVEMSDTVSGALKKTNDYKNQGEWDTYVDSLLSNKSINKQQADYLKGMYETEQNTNFVLDNSINQTSDISYYNSDEDIVSKGNVYVSRNGNTILAETKNVIDSSSNKFERINKDYQKHDEKGEFIGDIGEGVPFGSGNKFYVSTIKDGEQVFVEYKVSTNYNKLTNNKVVNESQEEHFDYINSNLNKQSGTIKDDDGYRAYTYNEETNEYTSYLDFVVLKVGRESGEYYINGTTYELVNDYKDNGKGGIIDVEDDWNVQHNDWSNSDKVDAKVKGIVNEFIKNYFDGDKAKFSQYIKNYKETRTKAGTAIVEYPKGKGVYYTINDGELWELKKK